MPEIDVQDELVDTFEPSALPPAARDGSLELPPLRAAPRPHPRLCEQGPCEHYHQFKIQMDHEQERATKGPDGELVQPASSFHVQTHHYCYPTMGVEMRLGSLPILQCNRWTPIIDGVVADRLERVRLFWISPAGERYTAELEAWRAEREALDDEIAKAERQAADDLAAMAKAEADELYFTVVLRREGIHSRPRVDAKWDETVAQVAARGLADILSVSPTPDENGIGVDISKYDLYDWRNKKLNPAATVAQAGLTKGDAIGLERKKGPTP